MPGRDQEPGYATDKLMVTVICALCFVAGAMTIALASWIGGG